jgi:hypothetical protein
METMGFLSMLMMVIYKGKGKKVKGKVVPVLPLTEHHAMKAYWGVKVQLHPFFDLGTRRRLVFSFTP